MAMTNEELHKLRGQDKCIRTSLHVVDVGIFMAPIRDDINMLTAILECFEEIIR
jgi:hypothetical protein